MSRTHRRLTSALGLHFLSGGVILILGCNPTDGAGFVRRWPALHRWLGRIYVRCRAAGGPRADWTFILVVGTIGGRVMDIGFGLYGALNGAGGRANLPVCQSALPQPTSGVGPASVCACDRVVAVSHGLWILACCSAAAAGIPTISTGPFDHVMAFFFLLAEIICSIVEAFIRAQSRRIAQSQTGSGGPIRRGDGLFAARHVLLHQTLLGSGDPASAGVREGCWKRFGSTGLGRAKKWRRPSRTPAISCPSISLRTQGRSA